MSLPISDSFCMITTQLHVFILNLQYFHVCEKLMLFYEISSKCFESQSVGRKLFSTYIPALFFSEHFPLKILSNGDAICNNAQMSHEPKFSMLIQFSQMNNIDKFNCSLRVKMEVYRLWAVLNLRRLRHGVPSSHFVPNATGHY